MPRSVSGATGRGESQVVFIEHRNGTLRLSGCGGRARMSDVTFALERMLKPQRLAD